MQVSQGIKTLFDNLLAKEAIPMKYHDHFRKWLRYYLDFCQKYNYPQSERKSLPHFLKKLHEKNQTSEQQKQASRAISLFYKLMESDSKKSSENLSTPEAVSKRYNHYHLQM